MNFENARTSSARTGRNYYSLQSRMQLERISSLGLTVHTAEVKITFFPHTDFTCVAEPMTTCKTLLLIQEPENWIFDLYPPNGSVPLNRILMYNLENFQGFYGSL